MINQVKYILNTYGNKIKLDKHLILIYWQLEGVEMNKETISTPDFLNKASNPEQIINARRMLECME